MAVTAVAVCTAPPRSDEWLQARRSGIGASEAATALGMNRYQTPLQLWIDKLERDPAPFAGNYATERGHLLEPFVLAEYQQRHPGAVIETAPDIPSILAHPDHPELRASLDALAHERDATRAVEVKTAAARAARQWDGGLLPDTYMVQVQMQLAVTGLEEAHVAADLAGDYEERVIPADPEVIAELVEKLTEWWWKHLDPNGPRKTPKVDPQRDTAAVLARVWTPDLAAEVELPGDLASELLDARAQLKAAERAYSDAQAAVMQAMGPATAAYSGGQLIATWRTRAARERLDLEALKRDGLYSRYTIPGTPGRTFLPKTPSNQ